MDHAKGVFFEKSYGGREKEKSCRKFHSWRRINHYYCQMKIYKAFQDQISFFQIINIVDPVRSIVIILCFGDWYMSIFGYHIYFMFL